MEQRQELLTVEHLTKSYDGKGKALHDMSLSLRRGEFVTVIGPSGAGKSTFLRCVNRLIDASEGSIVFDGREITSMNKRQMRKVRRDIGMIFQHYNLVHRATAIENVLQGRLGYLSDFRGIFGFTVKKTSVARSSCWTKWALLNLLISAPTSFPADSSNEWALRVRWCRIRS